MFLWIVLSCLYFVPGVLLLQGALWFVTKGKHDFYDVLKVVCLASVLFPFAARLLYLVCCFWPDVIIVCVILNKFISIITREWKFLDIAVYALMLLFVVQTLLCAWFVRLGGGKRLGLLRAAAAIALQEFMAVGFLVICCGLFRLFALFVASLGR
ncbi:hypothetical protein [Desulfovibrio sp. TomC]|uniref:hypothetical protein n=1 Tax=Desulfovibrio sp. TomC TaxID=1562888 RepID=UPI0005BABC72|nr:hypothetical protein [Desulfovibrio sp. TomC]